MLLYVKGLQNYQRQKLEVEKNCQLGQIRIRRTQGQLTWQIFFQPPYLTSDIFATP